MESLPTERRRTALRPLVLALFFIATQSGCALAAEILFAAVANPATWTAVDRIARMAPTPTPSFDPVVDSVSEDARFVASHLASCPLDQVRIVHRTRRRFTATACGHMLILRCRVPRDGSPTRCRELHPRTESTLADAPPAIASEGRLE